MRGGREAAPILALMQQSVARMSALIDNVLDFARGRLGGGIAVNRAPQLLEPVLNQVVAELRSSFPDSTIETDFDLWCSGSTATADASRNYFPTCWASARAHGGKIDVTSSPQQTRFTFRMPV